MARLHRVSPGDDPGLTRTVAADGAVRIRRADGSAASARERRRVEALVIPPAWTDVWICVDPLGHVQAVGTDAAGRRQYLYHPQWQDLRGRSKYERSLWRRPSPGPAPRSRRRCAARPWTSTGCSRPRSAC